MAIAERSDAAQPISDAQRPAFERVAGQMRLELASAAQTLVTARAE